MNQDSNTLDRTALRLIDKKEFPILKPSSHFDSRSHRTTNIITLFTLRSTNPPITYTLSLSSERSSSLPSGDRYIISEGENTCSLDCYHNIPLQSGLVKGGWPILSTIIKEPFICFRRLKSRNEQHLTKGYHSTNME